MRVTHVSILPTEAAQQKGRPALTPELLAATGARYSRNNEGLEAILAKIDCADMDKSVDAIFKMTDFGHASIMDMSPVAMFVDDISIFAAYQLFTLCSVVGGQESSTRYIKLNPEGLVDPGTLRIPFTEQEAWREQMMQGFAHYEQALAFWDDFASKHPIPIPRALRDDPSPKAQKAIERIKRNFGFDRARYYLPVAASTNMMMVMFARQWTQLIAHLLATELNELQEIAVMMRWELELATPRLMKHADYKASTNAVLRDEFSDLQLTARYAMSHGTALVSEECDCNSRCAHKPGAFLTTMEPKLDPWQRTRAIQHRTTRYDLVGKNMSRIAVRFGWDAVSMAEIRDLNRHRTGTKYCPLVPVGFYSALDQLGEDDPYKTPLGKAERWGWDQSVRAMEMLAKGDQKYIYRTLLGTQYPFEHVTTADKFIYETELRTGTGAHYRYAEHMHDVLRLWYTKYPETRGLVLEGQGEPE